MGTSAKSASAAKPALHPPPEEAAGAGVAVANALTQTFAFAFAALTIVSSKFFPSNDTQLCPCSAVALSE